MSNIEYLIWQCDTSLIIIIIIIIIIKTFITRKFAEAANARSVDSTEEKRLQSLFEDAQRDVR